MLQTTESFGERLWAIRNTRGWTQTELAEAAGISITTVTHLETGKVAPRLGTVRKLARALGLSVEELGEGKDPRQRPLGERFLRALEEMVEAYSLDKPLDWSREDLERIAALVDGRAQEIFSALMEAGYDELAQKVARASGAVRAALLSRVRDAPNQTSEGGRQEAGGAEKKLQGLAA